MPPGQSAAISCPRTHDSIFNRMRFWDFGVNGPWGQGLELPRNEQKYFKATPDPQIALRIDVERALAGVPRFDRAVAVALAQFSVSEASRFLGVSRSTVYEAIERLRECFSKVGLQPTNWSGKLAKDDEDW
jgi:hypothetical protein